jgi:hypothetical protein
MSAYAALRRKPVQVKLFCIRKVFCIPLFVIDPHHYVSRCWNNMTTSKTSVFDCFSKMKRDWEEKSHNLFENLKDNKIQADVTQLVGEKQL